MMQLREIADAALRVQLRQAYLDACELELSALKPGNVGLHGDGHGMGVEHFRLSAEASADPLLMPGTSVGERVHAAVTATRERVGCNTNLGIVLLCAPLLQAASLESHGEVLRRRLHLLLLQSTLRDCEWVYDAIRVASPGGLGSSPEHDVTRAADCTLLEAMMAGADRDRIAYQYATDFADIFDYAVPYFLDMCNAWRRPRWAAVGVYLGLLRRFPDSHVVRKHGGPVAREVSAKAARLEAELHQCGDPELLAARLMDVDAELKRAGINPGTTADLTVATVLAARLESLPGQERQLARPLPDPSRAFGGSHATRCQV